MLLSLFRIFTFSNEKSHKLFISSLLIHMKRHILAFAFIFAFAVALAAQIRPVVISEVFYDTPLEEDAYWLEIW